MKRLTLLIVLFLMLTLVVSGAVWYWLRSSIPTPSVHFKSQEECQQKTGKICSFAQCDYKCGSEGGFKRWVATSRNFRPTPEIWDENACQELTKEIKGMLDQANYCQKDTDCHTINLGCPFGCSNLVNINTDTNSIGQAYREFEDNCGICIYKCSRNPEPGEIKCRDNKCIDIRFNK